MIYVIVEEKGQYSDYSMAVLCAYTDKAVAEAKLAKLQEELPILKSASEEYGRSIQEWHQRNPRPTYPHETSKWWQNSMLSAEKEVALAQYREACKAFDDQFQAFDEQLCKQLAEQCNLLPDQFRYWYDRDPYDISILEVEGY
jgi:isopenicillin N synthase-like dioxygenase